MDTRMQSMSADANPETGDLKSTPYWWEAAPLRERKGKGKTKGSTDRPKAAPQQGGQPGRGGRGQKGGGGKGGGVKGSGGAPAGSRWPQQW